MLSRLPKLSTARESLARLNARIAVLADPQHKAWFTTYRDHWWAEVVNDVDAAMVTMSLGPIRYRFDGHPFMDDGGTMAAVRSWSDTEAMYAGVVALGIRMAGPFDDERIFFDEHGISVHCILSTVYRGIFLANHSEPTDPNGFYLLRWPSITTIRFDTQGLMMGEDIQNGAPILVRQVDASMGDLIVDGPLPAAA
jgi:hypothetical protein